MRIVRAVLAAVRTAGRAVHQLWRRVHQPRVVSFAYFVQYAILTAVGAYALSNPPSSLQGQVGILAMAALATLLVLGGTLGTIASLPGWYWLERLAVIGVGLSAGLYLFGVLGLHFTSPGNRLLQAGFVTAVLLHQIVRWARIKGRPYRPRVAAEA